MSAIKPDRLASALIELGLNQNAFSRLFPLGADADWAKNGVPWANAEAVFDALARWAGATGQTVPSKDDLFTEPYNGEAEKLMARAPSIKRAFEALEDTNPLVPLLLSDGSDITLDKARFAEAAETISVSAFPRFAAWIDAEPDAQEKSFVFLLTALGPFEAEKTQAGRVLSVSLSREANIELGPLFKQIRQVLEFSVGDLCRRNLFDAEPYNFELWESGETPLSIHARIPWTDYWPLSVSTLYRVWLHLRAHVLGFDPYTNEARPPYVKQLSIYGAKQGQGLSKSEFIALISHPTKIPAARLAELFNVSMPAIYLWRRQGVPKRSAAMVEALLGAYRENEARR